MCNVYFLILADVLSVKAPYTMALMEQLYWLGKIQSPIKFSGFSTNKQQMKQLQFSLQSNSVIQAWQCKNTELACPLYDSITQGV